MSAPAHAAGPAGLSIRLLSMLYESLLLTALLFVATAIFVAIAGDSRPQPQHLLLQVYLVLVAGAYFTVSWSGGRCTLPMRTWRLRLVDRTGSPIGVRSAAIRFVFALLTLPPGLIGVWWAFFDRERLFLHDRLAGTRVLREPPRRN